MISRVKGNGDKYGCILVEGTETIQNDYQRNKYRAEDKEKDDASGEESAQSSIVSGMSGMTSAMGSIATRVEWDKGTRNNVTTVEKTEKRKEKSFKKTLKTCGIRMKEMKDWIGKKPDEYRKLYEKAGKKEYYAMKLVIKEIIAERLSEEDEELSLADIKEFSQQSTQSTNDEENKKLQGEEVNSQHTRDSHPIKEESSTQNDNENKDGQGGRGA